MHAVNDVQPAKASSSNNYSHLERTIYVAFWAIVLLMPVLIQLYGYVTDTSASFEWKAIFGIWLAILPFFILFWVHDLLVLPLLIKRRRWLYSFVTLVLVAATVYGINYAHDSRHRAKKDEVAREVIVRNAETGEELKHFITSRNHRPLVNMFMISHLVFAMFAVSANIALRLYFNGLQHRRRIAMLEAENNATRLKYLKYQINPHFFMNTLNNIHALIDIDAERAQQSVVDLSKMMRYVLYDIGLARVELGKEIEFLRNYIQLMRIRLSGDVEVSVSFPDNGAGIKVPPLLFITFVENVFKHGVSHAKKSFINIKMSISASGKHVVFEASNSNHSGDNVTGNHHGIGLENLRHRLDLLYNGEYTLSISNNQDIFTAYLLIPVIDENAQMHSR